MNTDSLITTNKQYNIVWQYFSSWHLSTVYFLAFPRKLLLIAELCVGCCRRRTSHIVVVYRKWCLSYKHPCKSWTGDSWWFLMPFPSTWEKFLYCKEVFHLKLLIYTNNLFYIYIIETTVNIIIKVHGSVGWTIGTRPVLSEVAKLFE